MFLHLIWFLFNIQCDTNLFILHLYIVSEHLQKENVLHVCMYWHMRSETIQTGKAPIAHLRNKVYEGQLNFIGDF